MTQEPQEIQPERPEPTQTDHSDDTGGSHRQDRPHRRQSRPAASRTSISRRPENPPGAALPTGALEQPGSSANPPIDNAPRRSQIPREQRSRRTDRENRKAAPGVEDPRPVPQSDESIQALKPGAAPNPTQAASSRANRNGSTKPRGDRPHRQPEHPDTPPVVPKDHFPEFLPPKIGADLGGVDLFPHNFDIVRENRRLPGDAGPDQPNPDPGRSGEPGERNRRNDNRRGNPNVRRGNRGHHNNRPETNRREPSAGNGPQPGQGAPAPAEFDQNQPRQQNQPAGVQPNRDRRDPRSGQRQNTRRRDQSPRQPGSRQDKSRQSDNRRTFQAPGQPEPGASRPEAPDNLSSSTQALSQPDQRSRANRPGQLPGQSNRGQRIKGSRNRLERRGQNNPPRAAGESSARGATYTSLVDRYPSSHPAPSVPIPTDRGIKLRSQRGSLGKNWWARRWIEAMERLVDPARLQRGRSYARSGQVLSIAENRAGIEAQVQGSRPAPYRVAIQVTHLSNKQWDSVVDALAEQALFTAQLLAGEMPANIEDVFQTVGVSLFPSRTGDLTTSCSCPDWANPCKHVAATHYILGDRFDDDPFLLFRMRGRTQDEILDELRLRRGGVSAMEEEENMDPLPVAPALVETIARFYESPENLDSFPLTITPPTVDMPILKRLGDPAFLTGVSLPAILKPVYDSLTRYALRAAYTDLEAEEEENSENSKLNLTS